MEHERDDMAAECASLRKVRATSTLPSPSFSFLRGMYARCVGERKPALRARGVQEARGEILSLSLSLSLSLFLSLCACRVYRHWWLTNTGVQVLAKAALEKELTVQKTEVDRLKSQLQTRNNGGDSEGGSVWLPGSACLPVCVSHRSLSLCLSGSALLYFLIALVVVLLGLLANTLLVNPSPAAVGGGADAQSAPRTIADAD